MLGVFGKTHHHNEWRPAVLKFSESRFQVEWSGRNVLQSRAIGNQGVLQSQSLNFNFSSLSIGFLVF